MALCASSLLRGCSAALLLASCATTQGLAGRELGADGGEPLRGPIVGLSPRAIADRRDFTYAVELSKAPAVLGWTHLTARGFRLGLWSIDPQPRAAADVRLNGIEHDVEALAFSPDGARVVAASRDGSLRVFESASGKPLREARTEQPLVSVAWSPDGRFVAAGGAGGRLSLFDASTLEPRATLQAHDEEVRALAFDPSGELWSGGWDKTIARFAPREAGGAPVALEERARFTFPHYVQDLSLSRDGARLGVAFGETKAERSYEVYQREKKGIVEPLLEGNCAAMVDARTGAVQRRFVAHHGVVATAAISPDGESLASGGWDRRLLVFSGASAEPIAEERFGWSVRRARFSRDGRYLAVGAWTPQKPSETAESDPAAVVYDVRYPAPAAQ